MTNFFAWLPARWLAAFLLLLASAGPALAQTTSTVTVTTNAAGSVTESMATLSGTVTGTVTQVGVVYTNDGNPMPTTSSPNKVIPLGTSAGSYSTLLDSSTGNGLMSGTYYTFRFYAITGTGSAAVTTYGNTMYFVTVPEPPMVSYPSNGNQPVFSPTPFNTPTPTYTGTSAAYPGSSAASLVTVYVGKTVATAVSIGSITTGGTINRPNYYSLTQPTPLADDTYVVFAKATVASVNSPTSGSSNVVTFTVDTTPPTATIISSAVTSGGTVPTAAPVSFTVNFSETVFQNMANIVTVTNGTLSSLTAGSTGKTYTFMVTPTTPNTPTVVNVPAGVVKDAAGNTSTAATPYSFTYTPPVVPTVTTDTPLPITGTSAVLGGNVTSDGGAVGGVTERGVVYSRTNPTPTTSDTKVQVGSGTGTYSQTISGLTPGVAYYVRAYATNNVGTNYGSRQMFTIANTAGALAFDTPLTYSPAGPSLGGTGRLAVHNLRTSSGTGFNDRIFYTDPPYSNIEALPLQQTSSTPQITTYQTGGTNPTGLGFGDVNSDGYEDIVSANSGSNNVSVILTNQPFGTPTAAHYTYSTGTGSAPQGAAVGDVNGDGLRDIVTANTGTNTVGVLLNAGNTYAGNGAATVPTFPAAPTLFSAGSGSAPKDVVLGDLDGDGKLDIVTVGTTVGVLLSSTRTSPALFGPVVLYSGNSSWVALGDADNNGSLDIITGAGVLLNTGPGTFGSLITSSGGGIAVGDLNLDGKLDLVVLAGYIGVRLGTGGGQFGPANYNVGSSLSYGSVLKAAIGDVNSDGRPDIVASGFDGFNEFLAVLLNTATPLLPTLTSLSASSGQVGSSLTLTGTNLDGVTKVSFNGVAATTFAAVNATTVTATIPAGATSGNVTVTTSAMSNGLPFTVTYPNMVVSTAGQTIAGGTYNSITVNTAGVATLSGDVTVNTSLTINDGATLNDGCATISGAGSFTLAAGGTLGICNAAGITSSGAVGTVQVTGPRAFSTDASYVYSGTAAQSTGTGLPAILRNLSTTNASDVTLTAPTSATQVVTVGGAGNLALNGNALTLLSNAAGTALVVNAGTGIVSGNTAVAQRYIDGSLNSGAGYRHYSAPVTGTTLADFTTSGFTPVVNAAYNTSATPATVTPFPTLFTYDQSRLASTSNNLTAFDKGWVSPASLTTPILPGMGYIANINAGQLVDFVGTLNNSALTVNLLRTSGPTATDGGWALLGNPFPAPLDLSLVAAADRTNLDAAAYVVQSTGPYAGGYRAYVNGVSTSASNNPLLALGQAFFMRVSTGQTNGSFTFRNAQRVTSFASQAAFQRTTTDPRPTVRLELAGAGLADGWVAYAETGATPNFDSQFDAGKLPNSTGLNLSSTSPLGENLAIDGYPAFTANTILPLTVGVPAAGTYTLLATALNNLPAGLDAYLRDSQTNQTVLLAAGTSYSFSMTTAQAATLLTGRFTLLFRPQSTLATVAALAATDVTVYPNPAHASFTVALPGVVGASTVQAELLNTLGQVVRRQSAALPTAGTALTIATADLAAGVYVLRLQAGATTLAKRVVVQ